MSAILPCSMPATLLAGQRIRRLAACSRTPSAYAGFIMCCSSRAIGRSRTISPSCDDLGRTVAPSRIYLKWHKSSGGRRAIHRRRRSCGSTGCARASVRPLPGETRTMTITLSPEMEARLRERAAREGKEPELLAEALLYAALDWEAQDRAEAIAGIRRGLEASAAGRVRPAAEVFANMRARSA